MAIKIIIKAMENPTNIVLNLSRSFDFLLAIADVIVKKTIDINIKVLCIIPKNVISKSRVETSECDQKVFTIGLFV
ncbi:hypothetical protein D3C72_1606560 [compost metagenome]